MASQIILDNWHAHQKNIAKAATDKLQAEQEKARIEQGERIRTMLLQGRQGNRPPPGFVPDDAQVEKTK